MVRRSIWLTVALVSAALACAATTEPVPQLIGEGRPVLFVGNSYLYTQDIPGIVQALADSAGGDQLAVMTIAKPDYALIDHWREGVAQTEIKARNFDWVVLQQGPSSTDINRDSLRQVTTLFAAIMSVAETPALFSAWPSSSRRQDFPRAIESYTLAAGDVNGVLLPVAASWLDAWAREPSASLYADALHPSQAGAYLSALVIYAKLLEKSPIGLPATVLTRSGNLVSVSAAQAATLQEAAAATTGFGSTGNSASSHARQPPTSARAFGHPAAMSCRATRALVASSCHAQYTTSVPCFVSWRSVAERSTSSGGMRTLPVICRSSAP